MSNLKPKHLIILLERKIAESDLAHDQGMALARVVEAHPALEPLLDFAPPDPKEIARQVGMTSAQDPDDEADLEAIDLGPVEWFEPSAGLAAVTQALDAVRTRPESIAAAIYEPGLMAADVIRDLQILESQLQQAQSHETRFRFLWQR